MGSITVERRAGLDVACPESLPATGQEQLGGGDGVTRLTVQDEGTTVDDATTTLNFTGAGVTATETSSGVVEVNVPGAALAVKDEGVLVDSAVTTMNFTGSLVTATQTASGQVQVAVSGSTLTVKDEGTSVDTSVATINFTGSAVTATQTSAGVVQVDVSSGGGSGWEITWRAVDNEPPAANFATLNTRNGHLVLEFDTSTQETGIFSGVLSSSYAGAGVIVDVWCAMASATSGTVGWVVAFERIDASSLDIDSDSFGSNTTITATTVPGTSGQVLKMSVNIADGSAMDSLAAGEMFRLALSRDTANDTATGDAQVLMVRLRGQ